MENIRWSKRVIAAGENFLLENEINDAVFRIVSGWAYLSISLVNGRSQIAGFCVRGDLIGLTLRPERPASHGATAITELEVETASSREVAAAMASSPETMKVIGEVLENQLQHVRTMLSAVGQLPTQQKIAWLIADAHKRWNQTRRSDEPKLQFVPFTQQHIASALGLSLVHTNKSLASLHKLNLVRMVGGRIMPVSLTALGAYAGCASEDGFRG